MLNTTEMKRFRLYWIAYIVLVPTNAQPAILHSCDIAWTYIVENPSLSLFFSSLVCIHLGYLRIDISGIDHASSFHLKHISLSFTVISFTPIFMLIDL